MAPKDPADGGGSVFRSVEVVDDEFRFCVAVAPEALKKETVFIAKGVVETGPAQTRGIEDILRRGAVISLLPEQVSGLVEYLFLIKGLFCCANLRNMKKIERFKAISG